MATLVLRPSRSIDRSINRSVVIKAAYALTTKSDLELFSPVTSSDEDITTVEALVSNHLGNSEKWSQLELVAYENGLS